MQAILSHIATALLPRRCASCGTPLAASEPNWCSPCDFNWARHAKPSTGRFDGRLQWACGWAWLAAEAEERRLVHALKYGGDEKLGVQLGRAMAREWMASNNKAGRFKWTVVPIPLHRRKQRKRGFNQSEMLAKGWAEVNEVSVLQALIRPRSGRSLTQLNRGQRLRRTEGLYQVNPLLKAQGVHGPSGLLIMDDVVTTGATLEAAYHALRTAWSGPLGFVTLLDAAR